jgi:hypothetical protein
MEKFAATLTEIGHQISFDTVSKGPKMFGGL